MIVVNRVRDRLDEVAAGAGEGVILDRHVHGQAVGGRRAAPGEPLPKPHERRPVRRNRALEPRICQLVLRRHPFTRQRQEEAALGDLDFTLREVGALGVLGDPGQGWTVALTTLMNERASIGAGGAGGGGGGITRLLEMVKFYGQDKDPLVRQELMKLYIGQKIAGYTNQRAMDKIKAGQAPGPELSGAKLSLTRNMQAVTEFAAKVRAPRAAARASRFRRKSIRVREPA